MKWYKGVVVEGYGMASGRMKDCPFPGGSLHYQLPIMKAHGIPVHNVWPGTINIKLSRIMENRPGPWGQLVMHWYPGRRPTVVDVFPVVLARNSQKQIAALNYGKLRIEGKPHAHPPEIIEVLAPKIDGLRLNEVIRVGVDDSFDIT